MADLSPAALAVRDAAEKQTDLDFRYAPMIAAAALRAAVAKTKQRQYGTCWVCDANELLDIAAELEQS